MNQRHKLIDKGGPEEDLVSSSHMSDYDRMKLTQSHNASKAINAMHKKQVLQLETETDKNNVFTGRETINSDERPPLLLNSASHQNNKIGEQMLTYQSAAATLIEGQDLRLRAKQMGLVVDSSDTENAADESDNAEFFSKGGESTKKNRRNVSKSDKKDERKSRFNKHNFKKVEAFSPSPMSFTNMMDEFQGIAKEGDAKKVNPQATNFSKEQMIQAHAAQLFPLERRYMPGDVSGNPAICEDLPLETGSEGFNLSINPRQKSIKNSIDNLQVKKSSMSHQHFQNRLQRSSTMLVDNSQGKKNDLTSNNIFDDNKNKSAALSIVSRATSNASYTVKTQTGQTPQHIQGKLPSLQNYALMEAIQSAECSSSKEKSFSLSLADPAKTPQNNRDKINLYPKIHSPVQEQHTLEQCENTYSSSFGLGVRMTSQSGVKLQSQSGVKLDLVKEHSPAENDAINELAAPLMTTQNLQGAHKGNLAPLSITDQTAQYRLMQSANFVKEGDNSMMVQNKKHVKVGFINNTASHRKDHENEYDNDESDATFTNKQTNCPINILDTQERLNNLHPRLGSRLVKSEMYDQRLHSFAEKAGDVLRATQKRANHALASKTIDLDDEDSLCRARETELEGADENIIRPEQIKFGLGSKFCDSSTKKFDFGSQRISKDNKRHVSTMSQAESYCPEYRANKSKENVFGDPWENQRNRNKHLVNQLIQGNQEEDSQKIVEQATIIFNENPSKGIQFCIDSKLFRNKATSIAKFLQYSPGLSKFAIGQYLAMPQEINQKVLEIYAKQFPYKEQPIDEALRTFLAHFRLPGEGDQIQRIIEKFSAAYRIENPDHFEDEDQAFLLAYCLIFLNTLNHNPNVDPKNRLTLDKFMKQCLQGAPKYPQEELKEIYERICTNQFKTDTQDIERILGRVAPFFAIDPNKPLTKDHDIQMVQRGQMFVKYGRRGQPHARFVYISSDEKYLVWCIKSLQIQSGSAPSLVPPQSPAVPKSKSSRSLTSLGATTAGKESRVRRIRLEDIIDIKVGCQASDVILRHNLPHELDNVCMSVITNSRTLDLKANDQQTRNKWVQYFYDRVLKEKLEQAERPSINSNMSQGPAPLMPFNQAADSEVVRKHAAMNRYSAYEKAWGDDETALEEIWVHQIMTNIEAHWDYVNNKPKSSNKRANQLDQKAKNNQNNHAQQSNTRRFSLFQCISCSRRSQPGDSAQAKNLKLKRYQTGAAPSGTSSLTSQYNSPIKVRQPEGGVASHHRLQSGRSEGSLVDNLQASPYLTQLLSGSKFVQSSSARDRGANNEAANSNVEVEMESLWRFGIPIGVRRVLWPFKIGNKLGISKELYVINRNQGKALCDKLMQRSNDLDIMSSNPLSNGHVASTNSQHSVMSQVNASVNGRVLNLKTLVQIQEDIDLFFQVTQCSSYIDMQEMRRNNDRSADFEEDLAQVTTDSVPVKRLKDQLLNMMLAFLVYRPDVGYVKNMSFLAGTFLVYCSEPAAFICFSNFVHEKLFIKLFRGYIQDIKLRIDLFDSYFEEMLPELRQHFQALEIDTAFFLADWLVTVFVKNLDFKIACRIWDNFILDGEIFAFKTGLAILSYFQSKFLKQCHFQIKEQLSNMRGLVDEHRLFAIIEEQIHIDEELFQEKCQSQTWGHQKAKLLGFANDYLTEII